MDLFTLRLPLFLFSLINFFWYFLLYMHLKKIVSWITTIKSFAFLTLKGSVRASPDSDSDSMGESESESGLESGLGLYPCGLGLGLWSNGLGLTRDGLGLWSYGLGLGLGLWPCGLGLTAGLTSPDSLQHCLKGQAWYRARPLVVKGVLMEPNSGNAFPKEFLTKLGI